ncbi:type VII secretion integral membrane protein EccD [Saccharothrix lopnurensis]|uniref:Type VII secretion integral membrane protein EccD n=1 Tax=Saccharothrix lopnurensis TaxID=1670621 RepID=A0ABW1PCM4_9PSEU
MGRLLLRAVRVEVRVGGEVDREVCRVSVITPGGLVDLVLPVSVPVADVLPAISRHTASEHRGLLICDREGEPLDTARSAAELGLRHGDVLVLRTPSSLVPEPGFDDPVEAVAAATALRPDHWRIEHTRTAWAVLAFVALTALAALRLPAVVSGAGAVLLLLAGLLAARAPRGAAASAALRGGAVPHAAACAAALVPGAPSQVLAASVAAGVTAVLAALSASSSRSVFVAAGTCAAVTAGAAAAWAAGVPPATVGAVLAVTGVLVQPLLPGLALRAARITVPPIPEDIADLRAADDDPHADVTAEFAHDAQRFLTAGLVVADIVVLAAIPVPVLAGPPGAVLCAVLAALVLVRARRFRLLPQRLAGAVTGTLLLSAALVGAALHAPPALRWPAALVVAAAATALALGGDRPSPATRRWVALGELGLVVVLLPVLAWVCGLYGWIAA